MTTGDVAQPNFDVQDCAPDINNQIETLTCRRAMIESDEWVNQSEETLNFTFVLINRPHKY
jgi:hypothetical protein